MRTLDVTRHGHLNHFTGDYDGTIAALRTLLDGDAFWEWEAPLPATRNALVIVGPVCVELFAPLDGAGIVASYLDRHPAGWHSLEWTVPDLGNAATILAEHDVRVTELDANYLFTHPKDLGGLTLELTFHHFDGDPRDGDGWDVRSGSANSPLGFCGLPEVLVATTDPEAAAARAARLVGLSATDQSFELADHRLTYIESDMMGVTGLVLPVRDLDQAAAVLASRGATTQRAADILWLDIDGARIGLTSERP